MSNHDLASQQRPSGKTTEFARPLAAAGHPSGTQQNHHWSWVCNDCGSHEFTSAISASDLTFLACSGCGSDEFHQEEINIPLNNLGQA